MRVAVRFIGTSDAPRFIEAVRASRALHRPWVGPPADEDAFSACLQRMNRVTDFGFIVEEAAKGELVGVVNLTNVVRGSFQSGSLGYYAVAAMAGRGLMKDGLMQVVRHAFGQQGLHRVEANIQPGNTASIALVRSCGFSKEGCSPKYLKIGGRWRDHERWALVKGLHPGRASAAGRASTQRAGTRPENAAQHDRSR